MKYIFSVVALIISATFTLAQTSTVQMLDKEKANLRRFTARNFSEERTFNLYWETTPSHDYTLKHDGNVIKRGRMRNEHTVKFSTVVPIVDKGRFTLNAKGYANFFVNDFSETNENYSYYKGELASSYILDVGGKPFILRGTVSYDGYNSGFGCIDATFTALYMMKNSARTTFGIGMGGMLLYDKIPVVPVLIYSHEFSPTWRIDMTLPSNAYMRCQFANRHRLSLGTVLATDQFYCKPDIEALPSKALYKNTTVKGELSYEYIVNSHFYFIARGGLSKPINSGYYKTNRKGDGDGNPLIEYKTPFTPFAYLGFSYNLFK